jgi:hypothetical protein
MTTTRSPREAPDAKSALATRFMLSLKSPQVRLTEPHTTASWCLRNFPWLLNMSGIVISAWSRDNKVFSFGEFMVIWLVWADGLPG